MTMIKKALAAQMLLVAAAQAGLAQLAPEQVKAETEKLAKHFLFSTSRGLVDKATGQVYHSTKNLNPDQDIALQDMTLEWYYPNGVLNTAMAKLAKTFDDQRYLRFARKNYQAFFRYKGFFRKQYEPGKGNWVEYFHHYYTPFWQYYMLTALDHCGAMGAGLYDAYQGDFQPRHKKALRRLGNYLLEGQITLEDGTYCRKVPRQYSVWLDDTYMSVPLLARMGQLTGKEAYFDKAVQQIVGFSELLFQEQKGLFYHGYFTDLGQANGAHWGRSNGWMAMALVQLLDRLPEQHPGRGQVLKVLRQFAQGLIRYQSANGMWHQLLDKPDSYLESSCTAMFTYMLAKGVNEGWLDSWYAQAANHGWKGLRTRFLPHGGLEGICIGTGLKMNLPFYYQRPTSANDTHGMSAALLAGSEVYLLAKNQAEK